MQAIPPAFSSSSVYAEAQFRQPDPVPSEWGRFDMLFSAVPIWIEAYAHPIDEGGSFLMEKKLEQLRKAYQNVPIPKELDQVVETALELLRD